LPQEKFVGAQNEILKGVHANLVPANESIEQLYVHPSFLAHSIHEIGERLEEERDFFDDFLRSLQGAEAYVKGLDGEVNCFFLGSFAFEQRVDLN